MKRHKKSGHMLFDVDGQLIEAKDAHIVEEWVRVTRKGCIIRQVTSPIQVTMAIVYAARREADRQQLIDDECARRSHQAQHQEELQTELHLSRACLVQSQREMRMLELGEF
jgi:hypothetical protein